MKTRCYPVWMHFQLQPSATNSNKATEAQNLTNIKPTQYYKHWGFCSVESYFSFSNIEIQRLRI